MRYPIRCLVVCLCATLLVAAAVAGPPPATAEPGTTTDSIVIEAPALGLRVDGPVEGEVSATELFLDGGVLAIRASGAVGGVAVAVDVVRVGFLPLYVGDVVVGERRLRFVSGPFAEPERGTLVGGTPLLRLTVRDLVRGPGEFVDTFVSGGYRRRALVHVPPGYSPATPMPMVLYLHGAGAPTGWSQDLFTRTREFADRAGFVVVIPDGIRARWNLDPGRGPDDLAFLATLLDRVSEELSVDSARVSVVGFSNGAMMAHLLACRMPGRFAAIAPAAGTLRTGLDCNPPAPVPVVMIHGTHDPLVEFDGEPGLHSAHETASFWATHNGCDAEPAHDALPDVDTGDGATVTLHRYLGCDPAGEVLFYEVAGGGHQWPGGLVFLSEALLGRRTRDFDANTAIWDFLSRQTLTEG